MPHFPRPSLRSNIFCATLVGLMLAPAAGCSSHKASVSPMAVAPNEHESDDADGEAYEDYAETDYAVDAEASDAPMSAPRAERKGRTAVYDFDDEAAPAEAAASTDFLAESDVDSSGYQQYDDYVEAEPSWQRRRGPPSDAYGAMLDVARQPLSTFSTDVDTAAYTIIRNMLQTQGRLPAPEQVRIEEFLNYFDYDYPSGDGKHPLDVYTEIGPCPWNPDNELVHIALHTRSVMPAEVPRRNLVFLIDVSGSMESRDKLPLLRKGLNMLTRKLRDDDSVAIVVYAGASGVVLDATPGSKRGDIRRALRKLSAGGSTNGSAGIHLAYAVARNNFVRGGINRVILATDGDFNVGTTGVGALKQLITEKRDSGIFLSVLGFGDSGMSDTTMETLADAGNGNYAFIDNAEEAHRVLVAESGATLMTVAKDVKIQVEFNPAQVASYRLIGYDNRRLANHEFNDDRKDAGDVGAGDSVTALYEIVPAHGRKHGVDPLRYQSQAKPSAAGARGELLTVKVRYKQPLGKRSTKFSVPVRRRITQRSYMANNSDAFRFSAAVAAFGMLLRDRDHQHHLQFGYRDVLDLAGSALGKERDSRRAGFVELVRLASRSYRI